MAASNLLFNNISFCNTTSSPGFSRGNSIPRITEFALFHIETRRSAGDKRRPGANILHQKTKKRITLEFNSLSAYHPKSIIISFVFIYTYSVRGKEKRKDFFDSWIACYGAVTVTDSIRYRNDSAARFDSRHAGRYFRVCLYRKSANLRTSILQKWTRQKDSNHEIG